MKERNKKKVNKNKRTVKTREPSCVRELSNRKCFIFLHGYEKKNPQYN